MLNHTPQTVAHIRNELGKIIVGQDEVIEQILVAILAEGHALIEGVPGTAKTLIVKTLARIIGAKFSRIQFTPDLMPSDITGAEIYRADEHRFEFQPGPVFANLVLADEINRAPAKVQSALLEAMSERQVSVAGTTYPLASPHLVMATQNPVEHEGTYPLPEAQLDRFLLKIDVSYPDLDTERQILIKTTGGEEEAVQTALSAQQLLGLQALVRKMPVGESVLNAILALVREARPEQSEDDRVRRFVDWGPSPRAGQALMLACRARALIRGRLSPSIEDVESLAEPCLAHRMGMRYDPTGEAPGLNSLIDDLVKKAA